MYDRHLSGSRNGSGGDRNDRNDRNDRSGGNDRNDRGDDYYNRYQGKRYGGGYKDQNGSYRRNDGHDYYSFRGSGSGPRRRQPNSYDSYQGSKYRPGKKYEGSWRREKDFERRPDSRNDGTQLLDERRSTSRKYDRDMVKPKSYARPAMPQKGKPKESEGREGPKEGLKEPKVELKEPKVESKEPKVESKEPKLELKEKENELKQKQFKDKDVKDRKEDPKEELKEKELKEKELKEKELKEKELKEKELKEKELKEKELKEKESHVEQASRVELNDNLKQEDLLPKPQGSFEEKEFSEIRHEREKEVKEEKEKSRREMFERPSSPVQRVTPRKGASGSESDSASNIADSSVLSPIGNTTTDDFIRNMDPQIPHKMNIKSMDVKAMDSSQDISVDVKAMDSPKLSDLKVSDSKVSDSKVSDSNVSESNVMDSNASDSKVLDSPKVMDSPKVSDDELSEAETIINETPYSMDQSKSFLRKRGPDSERRRLKRNIVISDSEASESENEGEKQEDIGAEKVAVKSEIGSESDKSESEESNRTPEKKPGSAITYKIKRDSTGRSQLQRACKKGNLAEVRDLLQKGANPNESDFGGFTCLHEAALAGHTEIVKFLISNGADVNKQALEVGDFETPLMDAAENKHTDTVSTLLENGADPNICNIDGYSTLTKLLLLKEEDDEYDKIIDLLKDFSPNQAPSPRKVMEDPTEGYFSDLAKKKSNPLIYKYAAQGLKESAAEDFVTNAFTLSKIPDILNLAARNGHVELVDILLGLNPGSFDINQKNSIGVNALLASVGRGVYDVTRFLLSKGADPNIKRDQDGMSPVEIAKHSSQYDPREVLLLEQKMSEQTSERGQGSVKQNSPVESEGERHDEPDDSPVGKRPFSGHSGPPAKRRDVEKAEIEEKNVEKSDEKKSEQKKSEDRKVSDEKKVEDKGEKVKESPEEVAAAAALHKAQEEQRIKAAEQAKMWQEKMQAKKKARKEMFLQAEKEKERRRKVEEEKRLEQLRQQEIEQQNQKAKEAEQARIAAAQIQAKKHALEIECIINEYPIGLRELLCGQEKPLGENHWLVYTPLYVFEVNGKKCVVDLQVSLLLSQAVSEMTWTASILVDEVSDEAKKGLWALFFEMVGVSHNGHVEKNGLAKFCKLQLHYVDLEATALYIKDHFPSVYERVWSAGMLTEVEMQQTKENNDSKETKEITEMETRVGFLPPRLQRRVDIIRTVQAANTPLW